MYLGEMINVYLDRYSSAKNVYLYSNCMFT